MLPRRLFLAGLATTLATPALAHPGQILSLRNVMDERLQVRWTGAADAALMADFSLLCRDRRTGDVHPMDPDLVPLLAGLCARRSTGHLTILSGFRTRRTNANLPGAARNSFHLRGQALDITSEYVGTAELHATLDPIIAGGLGRYIRSGFVHVDTGPWWRWGGGSTSTPGDANGNLLPLGNGGALPDLSGLGGDPFPFALESSPSFSISF